MSAGRLATGGSLREVGKAVRAAGWDGSSARASDLLLDGLALLTTEGYAAGAPTLLRALAAFRAQPMPRRTRCAGCGSRCESPVGVADDVSWDELAERQVRLARDAGALSLLPVALSERFGVELVAGNFADRDGADGRDERGRRGDGQPLRPHGRGLAGRLWRGDEATVRR